MRVTLIYTYLRKPLAEKMLLIPSTSTFSLLAQKHCHDPVPFLALLAVEQYWSRPPVAFFQTYSQDLPDFPRTRFEDGGVDELIACFQVDFQNLSDFPRGPFEG